MIMVFAEYMVSKLTKPEIVSVKLLRFITLSRFRHNNSCHFTIAPDGKVGDQSLETHCSISVSIGIAP